MDVASQNARKNWVASRVGLPTIGSSIVNAHGIQWVVQNHATVPTADTLQRWRCGDIRPGSDLYPVVAPLNLSPALSEFICAIDRCTTKTFAFLDTMPGRRKDGHVPGGNSIDTLVHPETNLLFLDVARVNETVIAHEFGHAWVQYVDECEDQRTLEDAGDPQRTRLVSFVQSFVLDLKVNDLIDRKGFDMTLIRNDQGASLCQLAELLSGGYRPEYPAEEVFMALAVADAMIRRDRGQDCELAHFSDSLAAIQDTLAPMVGLADRLAGSVRRHGYDSHSSVTACIDECLLASFEHCGDRIDLDAELVLLDPEEPDRDKFPGWLPILAPRAKCLVGRYMARNEISSDWNQMIAPSITGRAKLTFVSPAAGQRFELPLGVTIGPPTRYSHLGELEAELLSMKIRNRTGSLQLHGGPPHSLENCLNEPPQPPPGHGSQGRIPDPPGPAPGAQRGFLIGPSWPGRPYMAGTAHFLTAARLEEQRTGEHPYAYANNNPVTYKDPSGMGVDLAAGLADQVPGVATAAYRPTCVAIPQKGPSGGVDKLCEILCRNLICNGDKKCTEKCVKTGCDYKKIEKWLKPITGGGITRTCIKNTTGQDACVDCCNYMCDHVYPPPSSANSTCVNQCIYGRPEGTGGCTGHEWGDGS